MIKDILRNILLMTDETGKIGLWSAMSGDEDASVVGFLK